jgi:hypothetical protein
MQTFEMKDSRISMISFLLLNGRGGTYIASDEMKFSEKYFDLRKMKS